MSEGVLDVVSPAARAAVCIVAVWSRGFPAERASAYLREIGCLGPQGEELLGMLEAARSSAPAAVARLNLPKILADVCEVGHQEALLALSEARAAGLLTGGPPPAQA